MKTDTALDMDVRMCVSCPLYYLRGEGGLACPAEVGQDYQPGGLAVMGEAPGADENKVGRPLVGSSGKLADKLYKKAGTARREILLLNRIRCRPPRNAFADYPEAHAACEQWTKAELAVYAPSVVLLLGGHAMTPIYGAKPRVGALSGTVRATGPKHRWRPRTYVATYHPAAELYAGRTGEVAEIITRDLRLALSLVA